MVNCGPIQPIIGITADATDARYTVGRGYVQMVLEAGGTPIVLPSIVAAIDEFIALCDGFVFSGGDDPDMAQWGVAMHPKARAMHPERQAFETRLLAALDGRPDKPLLGICLGMQLLGLHAGGVLDQHLPDTLPTAGRHFDNGQHHIEGELGQGEVKSHHRQALTHAGRFRVVARSDDGVIEAIRADDRPFCIGVQWHPERTADEQLGIGLFRQLVNACRTADPIQIG